MGDGLDRGSAAPSAVDEVTIGYAADPPRRPAPARSRRAATAVEPTVRIGLNQNAATVTVRSAEPFTVAGRTTRAATFAAVLAVDPNASGPVAAADLQYRITVKLDDGATVVMPAGARVRIEPPAAPLEIETRAYRGALEIFGNTRRTLTVVNELPLEDYLRGVVPNELNPAAFGQLEALKAQAVAARTYIQRNMGQYKKEGYDICATDACQVYFGVLTEDPLATQAVMETRGVVATYEGRPINALYSSTCGGRTEDAEHIFTEKVPYLVSVSCEYKHPEMAFATSRAIPDWKDGVLAVAGVKNYSEAARFMGLPSRGEPASTNAATLAAFIRETFYPVGADRIGSLVRQGAGDSDCRRGGAAQGGALPADRQEVRLRVAAGRARIVRRRRTRMRLLVGGQLKEFSLAPDALVYHRVGDSRLPLRKGVVDRRRARGLPRGRGRDPDAGLPDQLRQSCRGPLFAPGAVAGAQDEGGARYGVPLAGDRGVQRHARHPARAVRAAGQHRDHRHQRTPHRPARCACARCCHCATACSRTTSSATRPAPSSARRSSAAAGDTASACARWAPMAWRWRARPTRRS